jgi:N-glycosylase/DNA lyase
MESLYFDGDTHNATIAEFAKERYGEYGGYAQQYLFYYGKTYKIGRKQENK